MSSSEVLLNYVLMLADQPGVTTTDPLSALTTSTAPADQQNPAELLEAAALAPDRPISDLIAAPQETD